MMPVPPAPFSIRGAERPSRRSTPSDPISFKSATRAPVDDLLDKLKSALSNVPRSLANSIWHDFLSWLSSYHLTPTFSCLTSLPHIKSAFHSCLNSALASIQADEERAVALGLASDNLAWEVRRLSALEALEKDCGDGPVPSNLAADLTVARDTVLELSRLVDSLDETDVNPPASIAGNDAAPDPEIHAPLGGSTDPAATAAPAPPARAPVPWTESNYKDFYARTASAFPSVMGKFPLSELLIVMDSPIESKLLMPRALEVYTVAELKSATARGVRPWLNRYEDPIEPCKSWSVETFQRIYSRDSFCFLLARVAQRNAQWRDRKLEKLRSALSSRWRVEVTIERVPPRHDWVLCSIPAVPAPGDLAHEILSAALIRLSEGNASYVVQHLAPLSTLRDLDIHIKGSITDPASVFNQLKKKLLAYESSGAFLGWRVTGVRPSNAVSKYRASFLLDNNRVSWAWSHAWDHPHGSLPTAHTLLDFSPSWLATKPYACQCCYNSDHFSLECPLAHIRLGGVPVVSPVSLSLMLHKKPGEHLVIVDKSFPLPSLPTDLATRAVLDNTPVPFESPARPLPPSVSMAINASFKFLSSKLHSIMHTFDGLSMELIHELCSRHHGDMHMILSNLASRSFDIPWRQDEIDRKWSIFRRSGHGPAPRSSSPLMIADSASPPRYLKLVQFVHEILHPLPPIHPVPNLPEIVASCHGDLQAIMRHLEVVHRGLSQRPVLQLADPHPKRSCLHGPQRHCHLCPRCSASCTSCADPSSRGSHPGVSLCPCPPSCPRRPTSCSWYCLPACCCAARTSCLCLCTNGYALTLCSLPSLTSLQMPPASPPSTTSWLAWPLLPPLTLRPRSQLPPPRKLLCLPLPCPALPLRSPLQLPPPLPPPLTCPLPLPSGPRPCPPALLPTPSGFWLRTSRLLARSLPGEPSASITVTWPVHPLPSPP